MRFSDIIGQKKAKNILIRAVKSNRVAHALLFCGIPGTGKKSMAKALTMFLNCYSPTDKGGCGICRSCKQTLNGNLPDLILVKPKKEGTRSPKILIDHIRKINKRTSFSPLSKYRVIIIDQADSMTDEAANSFLKLLEEPPERNIFILNVIEPLNLLPTIVSRCQKIKFYPIPSHDIAEWLVKNKKLDFDTATVLSRICGGSIGRAITLIDKGFLKKREEWISLLIQLTSMHKEKLFFVAEKYSELKDDIIDVLMTWQSWLRDIMTIKESGDKKLLINQDLSHIAERASNRYDTKELIEALLLIHNTEQDIYKNRNVGLATKNLFIRLWKVANSKAYL